MDPKDNYPESEEITPGTQYTFKGEDVYGNPGDIVVVAQNIEEALEKARQIGNIDDPENYTEKPVVEEELL